MIFRHQFRPEHGLVGGGPVQIEDFSAWANELLWRTMAIEAPFHIKRMRFPRERHLIELPVAGGAADAFGDVNAVIEENKIWRVVNAIPTQRGLLVVTISDRRQQGGVFPNLAVARHTGFRGWHPGKGGLFDACVAVAAVNSQAVDMMLVTEGRRLIQRNHLASRPW